MKRILLLVFIITAVAFLWNQKESKDESNPRTKLYWFIPDGMRADPDVFTIYRWAQEGKLPNIKIMMDRGSYGYSIPDFPSHTPTNFASLLTGTHPNIHGVADGPMHTEGHPLATPSVKGFASTAKLVDPIWTILEQSGLEKIALLSIPGSTPPEIRNGITIRGRWGGWGADVHSIIYEPESNRELRKSIGRGIKLFFLGPELTTFVSVAEDESALLSEENQSWESPKISRLGAYELNLTSQILDLTNDNQVNYDTLNLLLDDEVIASLKQGEWSEWHEVKLNLNNFKFNSHIRVKPIKIWNDGRFRVKVLYDSLNQFIVEPGEFAQDLFESVGPMVDFADNWPAQLIYEPEDKQTFLEEARMSWDWHRRAAQYILQNVRPDVYIQDIYTPNQMLESRWWHGNLDPENPKYDVNIAESAMADVLELYQGIDAILGEMLTAADDNTIVALSSDHGVCSLHTVVKLNNLFAEKGWLQFKINSNTGFTEIDWENTKVIYLKMAHIFIDPNGLGGNWERASGEKYEELRLEVLDALNSLEDKNGIKPVVNAVPWEDALNMYLLPKERIGDVIIEARPNYFWFEEMDDSLEIFSEPLTSGYKQTIDPQTMCMRTPFMIIGPKVKRGHIIENPISHVDQLPTLLKLLGVAHPSHIEGRILDEIILK